jgi:hypothetical protein
MGLFYHSSQNWQDENYVSHECIAIIISFDFSLQPELVNFVPRKLLDLYPIHDFVSTADFFLEANEMEKWSLAKNWEVLEMKESWPILSSNLNIPGETRKKHKTGHLPKRHFQTFFVGSQMTRAPHALLSDARVRALIRRVDLYGEVNSWMI